MVVLACAALASPGSSDAQGRTGAIESASRATVFVRVIGEVDFIVPVVSGLERKVHRANIELATGSGFLVSPIGHVLTCHHVIADGERTLAVDGVKIKVTVKATRIDVYLPAAPGGATASPERYEASVVASSPELDVAVLSVSGGNLPAADLGDSDALEPGDGLDALGYPFGRDVEIAREAEDELPPEVSVSHGDFSAFRNDEQGTHRFIQTSAAVNPGSSGGPIVDVDGFVVGIVSRRLAGSGAGIGFAVPINLVKDFLESRGADSHLSARRMALGPLQAFDGKGVRMKVPWGLTDASPFRTRVDSGTSTPAALRIDRVLSPWDVLKLAEALSSGRDVEPFTPMGSPIQRTRMVGGRRLVTGRVNAVAPDGSSLRVEYTVVELGAEKLLVRYVGPPPQLAYNASAIRASLASVEGEALRGSAVERPSGWVLPAGAGLSSLRRVLVPAGWVQEPLPPLGCQGLPAVSEALSASPLGDFGRTLRAGVLHQPGLTAADASAACGTPSAAGAPDYQSAVSWLGANIYVAGRFVQVGDQLLHLAVVGPAEQRPALQDLFSLWMARLETPAR